MAFIEFQFNDLDIRKMVNSLNAAEFRQLHHWITVRLEYERTVAVANLNLTRDEIEILHRESRINCIKAVRPRLNIGLSEAMHLVNRYLHYMS